MRLLIVSFIMVLGACSTNTLKTNFGTQNPMGHAKWTTLLQQFVNEKGQVDYSGFVNSKALLQVYLDELIKNKPTGNWSKNAQIAYWINLYNAFTIKLVTDNYPVESIKDIKKGLPFINSVWDIKLIDFGNEKIDLNHVEHSILRKHFEEPRIHFAINCASFSCPRLLNEAYTAEKLEQQLALMTKDFLGDTEKNKITVNEIKLSKIFNWFKGDFTKNGSLIDFLNKYAPAAISESAKVSYLDYDWSLNE